MFTPTLRCECAQPGLIDTMQKWSIGQVIDNGGVPQYSDEPDHLPRVYLCQRPVGKS